MLYILDEEEASPIRLSVQEGLRESHRKLQISKKSDSCKNERQLSFPVENESLGNRKEREGRQGHVREKKRKTSKRAGFIHDYSDF